MAKAGSRNEGITRKVMFLTEDGKEHETHQEAQKHKSKAKFIAWCLDIECDLNGDEIKHFAEQIYNSWHVTKRKQEQ